MPADGFSGKSFDIGTVVSIISGIAFVPEENMYRVLWFMTGEKIRAVEWLIYQIEACAPYLRGGFRRRRTWGGLESEIEVLKEGLREIDRKYEGLNLILSGGDMMQGKSDLCYRCFEKNKGKFEKRIQVHKLPGRI